MFCPTGTGIRVQETMERNPNEAAVSPVIGVILMVAITVILAAVIAAFVFGMADEISGTRIVAATAQQRDATRIVVSYHGGQDAGLLTSIRWDVTPAGGSLISTMMNPTSGPILEVGKTATITGSFAGKDHVVATAHFSDGFEQVILDNMI